MAEETNRKILADDPQTVKDTEDEHQVQDLQDNPVLIQAIPQLLVRVGIISSHSGRSLCTKEFGRYGNTGSLKIRNINMTFSLNENILPGDWISIADKFASQMTKKGYAYAGMLQSLPHFKVLKFEMRPPTPPLTPSADKEFLDGLQDFCPLSSKPPETLAEDAIGRQEVKAYEMRQTGEEAENDAPNEVKDFAQALRPENVPCIQLPEEKAPANVTYVDADTSDPILAKDSNPDSLAAQRSDNSRDAFKEFRSSETDIGAAAAITPDGKRGRILNVVHGLALEADEIDTDFFRMPKKRKGINAMVNLGTNTGLQNIYAGMIDYMQ